MGIHGETFCVRTTLCRTISCIIREDFVKTIHVLSINNNRIYQHGASFMGLITTRTMPNCLIRIRTMPRSLFLSSPLSLYCHCHPKMWVVLPYYWIVPLFQKWFLFCNHEVSSWYTKWLTDCESSLHEIPLCEVGKSRNREVPATKRKNTKWLPN